MLRGGRLSRILRRCQSTNALGSKHYAWSFTRTHSISGQIQSPAETLMPPPPPPPPQLDILSSFCWPLKFGSSSLRIVLINVVEPLKWHLKQFYTNFCIWIFFRFRFFAINFCGVASRVEMLPCWCQTVNNPVLPPIWCYLASLARLVLYKQSLARFVSVSIVYIKTMCENR